MHNDQYPLLHSFNIELFDIKSDLTTLSGSKGPFLQSYYSLGLEAVKNN